MGEINDGKIVHVVHSAANIMLSNECLKYVKSLDIIKKIVNINIQYLYQISVLAFCLYEHVHKFLARNRPKL